VSRDASPVPRSLVWATGLDVLPFNRVVKRRSGFVVIRSPSNPTHYWGNFLLFDREPVAGDARRWEALFEEVFGDDPQVRHRTFAWDRTDGVVGAAQHEFVPRGYDLQASIGLVADPHQLVAHPRENRDVVVQALDPAVGADEALWDAVVELQVAGREDGHEENAYRSFARARIHDLRALFRAGRGAWYVAIEPSTGEVVGSCGVVVTAGRAGSRRWTLPWPTGVAESPRGSWSRQDAGPARTMEPRSS
jgi:hypothetical protein